MRVVRLDERLSAFAHPIPIPLDRVSVGDGDVVVVCIGFEDRSLHVLRMLEFADGPPTIVLIEYQPVVETNHLAESVELCKEANAPVLRYVYDRENPAGAAEGIFGITSECRGRIFIDVSGMSRLLIVQLLSAVPLWRGDFDRFSILYTEAERYHPSEEQFGSVNLTAVGTIPVQFLSWGVSQITVIPELSSTSMEDQPTHLFAFPTFDPQQLSAVRKDVEPSTITVVHGSPIPDHGLWRLQAIRVLNRIEASASVSEVTVETFDYRETIAALLDVYANIARLRRLVVCPTGSKMQTVAVGIVRAFLQDLTIVYPTPKLFSTKAYTSGAKRLYRLDLDSYAELLPRSDPEQLA